MNTDILLMLVLVVGIANSSILHHDSHHNQQLSACNLTSFCGPNGACKITEQGTECKCQQGFGGERCEYFISKRCRIYSIQHNGLKTCGKGQMCMPDNFYCHFYPMGHPVLSLLAV